MKQNILKFSVDCVLILLGQKQIVVIDHVISGQTHKYHKWLTEMTDSFREDQQIALVPWNTQTAKKAMAGNVEHPEKNVLPDLAVSV